MAKLHPDIDLKTINDAILGLVSQAILDGYQFAKKGQQIDNGPLNERRLELLSLIVSEAAVSNASTNRTFEG